MALNTRCKSCRHLLGPEDAVGAVTNPALCAECRERAARQAAEEPEHPSAVAGRQQKALAMCVVIDANALNQDPPLNPFDQAGRILIKTHEWDDATWERIGERAIKPKGGTYERKPISDATRELVRSVYRGRAQAPLQSKRAS